MTEHDVYVANAFITDGVFTGNPAAVVPLKDWLPDELLQAMARQHNLSETAFVRPAGPARYRLRWFTPAQEVPFCGHATLAAAHVLYTERGETAEEITFDTLKGPFYLRQSRSGYLMNFPADTPEPCAPPKGLADALGATARETLRGQYLVAVFGAADEVRALDPDMMRLQRLGTGALEDCVVATAPGDGGDDFVSRFFAPGQGIPEDPATGSAHSTLAPFWGARLGKTELSAFQASRRGARIGCRLLGERVELFGEAVTYLRGRVTL